MADPLSISSGVAGLIALAGSIVSTCYSYGCAVKGGPAEIQSLVDEIMSLAGVLTAVRALIDRATEQLNPNEVGGPDKVGGDLPPPYSLQETHDYFKNLAEPVAGSQKALSEVQEALRKAEVKSDFRLGKAFKRLVWPLKRDKTLDLVANLERYKSLYVLSLSTANASMTMDAQQTLNDIRSTQLIDRLERQADAADTRTKRVQKWLCPVQYTEAHKAARRVYLQGTGDWMLKRQEWAGWWDSDHAFLWLYGIPGSGKTVLMSTLLDHCAGKQGDSPLIYFYCDFRDKESQRPERVVGALILQLCLQASHISSELLEFADSYTTHGEGLGNPSFEELSSLLMRMLSSVPELVVVVDALDECLERTQLAQLLVDIWQFKGTKAKILVSSRQEADIESTLSGRGRRSIRVDAHNEEIEFYVSCSMARTPRLRKLSEELRDLVKDTLVKGSQGMFRWVQCQIEALSHLRTDRDIRQALTKMPRTLYGSYERILEEIEERDRAVARRALLWLAYGPTAMTLVEIAEAVVIDEDTTSKDPEACWDPQDILSVVGGLARYYSKTDAIELAHHSVKEFLEHADLRPDLKSFHLQAESARKEIGETMLRYLLLNDFNKPVATTETEYLDQLASYPLLPLAARSWAYYATAYLSNSDTTLALAQRLFDPAVSSNFKNWTQVLVSQGPNNYRHVTLNKRGNRTYDWRGNHKWFSHAPRTLRPLYYAASFGLLPIVQYLIKAEVPIDENGGLYGGGALHAAIFRHHTQIALLLINSGANLKLRDHNKMTPLDMATMFAPNKEIIQALRDNGGPYRVWRTKPKALVAPADSLETAPETQQQANLIRWLSPRPKTPDE